MFACAATGIWACCRLSSDLKGGTTFIPVQIYTDVGTLRSNFQTSVPALLSSAINATLYTDLTPTMPLGIRSDFSGSFYTEVVNLAPVIINTVSATFYTELSSTIPLSMFGQEPIPAPSVGSPLTTNLKTGLTHYYGFDGNLSDSVDASTPGVDVTISEIGFDFKDSTQGMSALGASITKSTDGLIVSSYGTDPNLSTPYIAAGVLDGGAARYIKITLKRNAGTGWDGSVFYSTPGHTYSGSFYKYFSDPTLGLMGDYTTVYLDMWSLNNGGVDWQNSTFINLVRFDFGNSAADVFEIKSIYFTDKITDNVSLSSYEASPISGSALRLSGGSCVKLPDSTVNKGTQTISVWASGTGELYSMGSDSTTGWGITFGDTATNVGVSVVATDPWVIAYTVDLPHQILLTSTVRHYLFEFDNVNRTLRLTVNNSLTSSVFTGIILRGNDNQYLGVGRTSGSGSFVRRRNGTLDEVAFWNRILTPQEKIDLYNAGAGRTYS